MTSFGPFVLHFKLDESASPKSKGAKRCREFGKELRVMIPFVNEPGWHGVTAQRVRCHPMRTFEQVVSRSLLLLKE